MRITGGDYRSRNVIAPNGMATRPTAAIVREAVFNILGSRIVGAAFLDLFCGSGIMSLEALSRGAESAWLSDLSAPAIQTAKKNVYSLKLEEKCRFYKGDYRKALVKCREEGLRFTIGYFDPPYAKDYYHTALTTAFDGIFTEDAICICEYATPDGFVKEGENYTIYDTRSYGSRSIALVRAKK